MNPLELFEAPSEFFMVGKPRRPFPVQISLTTKRKGEAPKCKTCRHFVKGKQWGMCTAPMQMACDRYERRKKKR